MAVPPPRVSIHPPELPFNRPVPTSSPSPSIAPDDASVAGSLSVPTPTTARTAGLGGFGGRPASGDGGGGAGGAERDASTQGGLQWNPKERRESLYSESGGVRQKSSKDRSGWGNLPVNVLHTILEFAQEGTGLDHVLQMHYGNKPKTKEIAVGLVQRVWFCRMRSVCTGWRNAVDSHSFWPEYTLLIDPSRHHSSTIDDFHESRLTPSTPSFPTLFHRARHTTLSTCIACRLNHPSRLGLYPAVRKRLTYTPRFGLTPTCERHAATFCTGCMRESEPPGPARLTPTHAVGYGHPGFNGGYPGSISPHERPAVPALTLQPANHGDVDECGLRRAPGSAVCSDCRKVAIWSEIQRELVQCARSGRVRGLRGPWLGNERVHEYIHLNSGTAPAQAYYAVEEQWLMDQTRWTELFDTALQLQNHEKVLKMQFLKGIVEETEAQRGARIARLAELRGEDTDGRETEEDAAEIDALYRQWWKEFEDDDFSSEDEDEDLDLSDKYKLKLKNGCINDFIADRVRHAFWVSPADEVHKLVSDDLMNRHDRSGAIHTAFVDIAANYTHPFNGYVDSFEYEPPEAMADSSGLISVYPSRTADGPMDPFLPPERLLRELDAVFCRVLAGRLSSAMRVIVRNIWEHVEGDDDAAEKRCAELQLDDLLARLTAWQIWVPTGLVENVKVAELKRELESTMEEERAMKALEKEMRGPRVEVVEDGEVVREAGVKEVRFSPVEDIREISDVATEVTEVESDAPSLGKRKSPDTGNTSPSSTLPSEKRSRSSPPTTFTPPQLPLSKSSATTPRPTTPPTQLKSRVDSPSHGKRKEPPSPVSHHIDRTKRQVTPPRPPRFDMVDGDGAKRTRVEVLGDEASAPASSMPSSPTPVVPRVVETEEEGGTSPTATSHGSSEVTVGTMPVTPEEDWEEVGMVEVKGGTDAEAREEGQVQSSVAVKLGKRRVEVEAKMEGAVEINIPDHKVVSAPAVTTAEAISATTDPSSTTTTPAGDSPMPDPVPDDADTPDTTDVPDAALMAAAAAAAAAAVEPEYDTESSSLYSDDTTPSLPADSGDVSSAGAGSGSSLDELACAHDRLTRYMHRAEQRIPFIPLPTRGGPVTVSGPGGANPRTVFIPSLNLGSGASRVLMTTWWEARDELRECKCGICERARTKAWEGLETVRAMVASGQGGWEALLP
ncbi:hypothetical protein IAT38_006368 [Cryptococcus sp. DSM 104549]